MHGVVLDVDLKVEQCGEAVLFLVDAVDLLELADGAPGARLGPPRHDVLVLVGHKLRH